MKKVMLWMAVVSVAVVLFFLSDIKLITRSAIKILVEWPNVWPNLISIGLVCTILMIMIAIMKILEKQTGPQKN